jgi:hypothetical protein
MTDNDDQHAAVRIGWRQTCSATIDLDDTLHGLNFPE